KQKNANDEAAKLGVTVTNLEVALGKAVTKPTAQFWRDGSDSPHQRCRSMCNAIRNIPDLKDKYWNTWQPYGNEYHKDVKDGAADEATKMKAKIANVSKSLATFKGSYKRDLGMV